MKVIYHTTDKEVAIFLSKFETEVLIHSFENNIMFAAKLKTVAKAEQKIKDALAVYYTRQSWLTKEKENA